MATKPYLRTARQPYPRTVFRKGTHSGEFVIWRERGPRNAEIIGGIAAVPGGWSLSVRLPFRWGRRVWLRGAIYRTLREARASVLRAWA